MNQKMARNLFVAGLFAIEATMFILVAKVMFQKETIADLEHQLNQLTQPEVQS